jgi:hypothetical protein
LSVSLNNKRFSVVFILMIITLIIDLSIVKIYGIGLNLYMSSTYFKVLTFILLSASGLIGQYLIIQYLKSKTSNPKISITLHLKGLHKLFRIFQYSLGGLFIFMISQIVVANYYYTVFLIAVTTVSYILVLFLLGMLSLRFISWFRLYRTSLLISYGLTSVSLTINAAITLIYVDTLLLTKPMVIGLYVGGSSYNISTAQILYSGYMITSIISFLLTWASTAFLLHHYSYKFGKAKYWIIVSSPLIYFLSQFLTFFPNLFDSLLGEDPIFYSTILTLLFTLSKVAGGFFFGIAFWLIAKNLPHKSEMKDYMKLCAYGFIFLFISNQAIVLVIAPYPPFGLISTAYIGFSAYLILVGIYHSALSASQDTKLRKSISKLAKSESKLLDSIAIAQVEQEIQSKALRMIRHNQSLMMEQTGVTSSLNEEDVKYYLHEVLAEIRKKGT